MSAKTFTEWQAYYSLEPFGPYAEFWRAAMIASMIANVNRAKRQKAFTPEDFMPAGMVDKPEQSPEAMLQRMQLYKDIQARNGKPSRS